MTNVSGVIAAWKFVRKRPSVLRGENSSGFLRSGPNDFLLVRRKRLEP
jgi:hypothetical protein